MIDVSHIPLDQPLRIIVGAGDQRWPGWIATHREELDLTRRRDWEESFKVRRPDALLCEHVWEHLDENESRQAAENVFAFLKPGGFLRVAVPDANFRNAAYQQLVAVGSLGHKNLYDYRSFAAAFTAAGFDIDLLEYCDDAGRFHFHNYDWHAAPIYRSLMSDHRNKTQTIGFASLILDARRPARA